MKVCPRGRTFLEYLRSRRNVEVSTFERRRCPALSATNAAEVMRTVIEDGQSELERASLGLAFSGFVAGLCVPFGAVAMATIRG